MITYVYQVETCPELFTSPELAIQSLRLSWHKKGKVVANAMLTQATIVFYNSEETHVYRIIKHEVYTIATHL